MEIGGMEKDLMVIATPAALVADGGGRENIDQTFLARTQQDRRAGSGVFMRF